MSLTQPYNIPQSSILLLFLLFSECKCQTVFYSSSISFFSCWKILKQQRHDWFSWYMIKCTLHLVNLPYFKRMLYQYSGEDNVMEINMYENPNQGFFPLPKWRITSLKGGNGNSWSLGIKTTNTWDELISRVQFSSRHHRKLERRWCRQLWVSARGFTLTSADGQLLHNSFTSKHPCLFLSADVYFSAVLSVWICQLDAVPLFSSMGELPEISGDEVQEVNVPVPLTEPERWHRMAKQLQNDVKTLRDEQFIRDFGETVNMSLFENERINTPVFKASDGCFLKNFSTERCLGHIYNILMWYKENLNYIERENLTPTLMNNVKHEMKRLLESINSQLQSKDLQVEDISSSLHAKSAWTQKAVTHSILFNLTNVMIHTCRAIPYLSKSKAGHSQRTKNKIKTDWISDKN